MLRTVVSLAVILAGLIGLGSIIVRSGQPQPVRIETIEGRPLLAQEGTEFLDPQVGLRFTPPADWAMQARSTEAPMHLAERRIVKYRRLAPSRPAAWLRVWVKDVPAATQPADVLRNRKAPEPGWKPQGEAETNLQIGGLPAARRTYRGPFDPDGRGNKEYLCELVAVKRGDRLFEFSGYYLATDEQGRRELRDALASVTFMAE